jgi:hypothetical protein
VPKIVSSSRVCTWPAVRVTPSASRTGSTLRGHHTRRQILAASGAALWAALARVLPPEATCGQLVVTYARESGSGAGHAAAALAALIYRLQPRVRLM